MNLNTKSVTALELGAETDRIYFDDCLRGFG